MESERRVLGVVTARGGSKGIPRKNLALLCGKPLLQYTAESALAAASLSAVILSTDDEEIAAVGRGCGLAVPFMRPKELAADDTPTLPVLQHAVTMLHQSGSEFDAICLLQPTNPMRRAQDIDACVEKLFETDADAVVTVLAVPHQYNPHWVYLHNEDGRTLHLATGEKEPISSRQALPPAFHRDGSVYVVRQDVLMEQNSLYGTRLVGFLLNTPSINIDNPDDLKQAEDLLRVRYSAA